MFYPEPGDDIAPALAICDRCDVRQHCLDAAMDRPERYGVWGGMSERRRKAIRAQRRTAAKAARDAGEAGETHRVAS